MKPTAKNIEILKKIGFKPEKGHCNCYVFDKTGWGFNLAYQANFKSLIKRMMKTEFERGKAVILEKIEANSRRITNEDRND